MILEWQYCRKRSIYYGVYYAYISSITNIESFVPMVYSGRGRGGVQECMGIRKRGCTGVYGVWGKGEKRTWAGCG